MWQHDSDPGFLAGAPCSACSDPLQTRGSILGTFRFSLTILQILGFWFWAVCCHVLHRHLIYHFQIWQSGSIEERLTVLCLFSSSVLGSGADVEPARGEAPCPAPVALPAVPGPWWHCGEDKTCLTTGEQQPSRDLSQLLTDISGYCDVL